MKTLLTTIAIILALSFSAIAAEDVSWSVNRLTCTIKDATNDWDYRTYFTGPRFENGVRVHWIRFHPGATNDLCTFEDTDDGDVKYFFNKCADTSDDRKEHYDGDRMKLYLDIDDTDGTWTAAYTAGCSITIRFWHTQEDD